MLQSFKDHGLSLFRAAVTSFVSLLVIEFIYRGSIIDFSNWFLSHSNYFLYAFVFMFFFFGSLSILKSKAYFLVSALFVLIGIIIAFASGTKEKLRGDPLLPSDLVLAGEAKNMLQFFSGVSLYYLIMLPVILILFLFILWIVSKKMSVDNIPKSHYITASICLLLFTLFLFKDLNNEGRVFKKPFGINSEAASPKQLYDIYGVAIGFISSISGIQEEKPETYAASKIEGIISEVKNEKASQRNSAKKPNVIIIMSEAFWDPTVMNNVSFNKDPLPNFHHLSSNFTSGKLHVPVFGGSTSNTEFEILTSMSTQFLSPGSVPYKNYIKEPIPALPHIFRSEGYETLAYHTYHNWFYERNSVYKHLGFDRFVSLEFFPNPVQDMMYYRDNEITDEILKQIEKSDKPNFIYAITMQNHGPYRTDAKKFYATMEAQLKEGEGSFTPDAENILEFYADNLAEIDKDLQRLINSLEQMNEKTMVVFFGDHLPLLGDNYQVYKEAGYFTGEEDFNSYLKMYQTPLLIWDNFSDQKENLQLSAPF
ncbi:LTA synthase family protein [Cytobacillus firmus]|uniref:LTA synthase family protein n=1 Tax=Cytobacillus firmus TaxID=1399 RepID=UPI0021874D4E|nr:LTA synthase family protein [Cytobacillus firmus]URM33426.1 LTA synthase family protein [Cytobacillus firmus]